MSELDREAPALNFADAVSEISAGAILRQAREAAGVHIGALAVALKVPVKKLEALEAGDLEQLPDAVFARALAATVCRTLKIDPEPVMSRLPQLQAPPLHAGSQEIPVRLDNSGRGMRPFFLGGLPRSILYLTGVLLLGALVVTLLPSLQISGDKPQGETADGVTVRTVPNLVTNNPSAVDATVATADTQASPTAPVAADAAAGPAATTAGLSQAAASAAEASTALTAAQVSAGVDNGATAVFNSREQSWVQVVDAASLVHLRKTLDPGESVRINGTLPLSVVIGRANAIDVIVRGKPFDLDAVSKDNVARFQIK